MAKIKLFFVVCSVILLVRCGNSQKVPTLEGKWECIKRERKSGRDTISNGKKISCLPDPWIISSHQMELVKGDPVNYIRRDSIIYIKGVAYYKIEKLAEDTLILLEIYCDNASDCRMNETMDLWDRMYFKRIK